MNLPSNPLPHLRHVVLSLATVGLCAACGPEHAVSTAPVLRESSSYSLAQDDWKITELGTLGGANSYGLAINEVGQIVGYSSLANGERHAYLWERGVMIDLGTLGGTTSTARDINNRGQVVGHSTLANGDQHAFVWEDGVMTDLGTLGGNSSQPTGINERGQIVGSSRTADNVDVPFLWEHGVMTALSDLPGQANAINDRGDVAGWVRTAAGQPYRLVRWQGGRMTDLGLENGNPWGINSQGSIAGRVGNFSQGFLWEGGTITLFGGLPGSSEVNVGAINNNGDLVGSANAGPGTVRTPVLWKKGQWTPIPLATAQGRAQDINNRGQIVGDFLASDGTQRAALWTRR